MKNTRTPAANSSAIGRMELLISSLLRAGVIVSMATILVGTMVTFVHHPDYLESAANLDRLTNPGAAFPYTLKDVADGIRAGRGQAIVALGLLLLITTPIMRVAVSIVAFALQRDRAFVLITAAVLAVLLLSFLLGTLE